MSLPCRQHTTDLETVKKYSRRGEEILAAVCRHEATSLQNKLKGTRNGHAEDHQVNLDRHH